MRDKAGERQKKQTLRFFRRVCFLVRRKMPPRALQNRVFRPQNTQKKANKTDCPAAPARKTEGQTRLIRRKEDKGYPAWACLGMVMVRTISRSVSCCWLTAAIPEL